ncbi:ribbon-helix-helix domain-containing protein [Streptomyces sp. NPDC003691]
MKISVSLPESDVAFLDDYAAATSADSRSAVIQAAIGLLRASELEAEYAQAWQEWGLDEVAGAWDGTTGDGLTDAAR